MEQYVRDKPHQHDLRRHEHHAVAGPAGPQDPGQQRRHAEKLGKLIGKLVEEEGVNEKMAEFINPIAMLGDQMTKFTTEIGFKGMQNPDEVGAAAVDYLRVAGHLVFGYLFARMAQVALREIAAGNTDPFYGAKLQTARFYFAKLFPETATLMRTARAGSKVLMDMDGPGLIRTPGCTVNFKHFCPGALMYKAVAAIILVAIGAPAWAQMTPEGLWRNVDDKTGEAKAEIRIRDTGAGG